MWDSIADGGLCASRHPQCPVTALQNSLDQIRPLTRHGDPAAESCAALMEAAAIAATAVCPKCQHFTDYHVTCLLRAAWEHARAGAAISRFALAAAIDDRRLGDLATCDGECLA
jgi:hypothetical protein